MSDTKKPETDEYRPMDNHAGSVGTDLITAPVVKAGGGGLQRDAARKDNHAGSPAGGILPMDNHAGSVGADLITPEERQPGDTGVDKEKIGTKDNHAGSVGIGEASPEDNHAGSEKP
ncbi:hypothetical protein LRS74_12940 [Streptomyces sp. LX-29]|uniref:hypothetical protein n=1 Tax=Streptomyces sp. LX-29 TaxID=2900152 RepID=UPI00240DBC7F|nr:hypothetical protein [Streptomyces sp. LX-29]WFB07850.1 hypothetical protein LRS74_12940 [Streptomyces sp. LX-29]